VPRCKWWIKLNPPGEFADHADRVADMFREHGLSREDVTVSYGVGPSAEVQFTVESLDNETMATLVRVAESLRGHGIRAEVMTFEVWLAPDERDDLEDEGGKLAKYDKPYRHEEEGGQLA
jgi:hypothetical protein